MMEIMLNKLLSRQLKRTLGGIESIPGDFLNLIREINNTYNSFEDDTQLMQNSIEINSQELRAAYDRQKQDAEYQKRTLSKIREAIYRFTHVPVENTPGEINKDDSGLLLESLFNLIENHKNIESQLRKLSRAVEQSPVSVVITNLDAVIEYINPTFTRITGYTPSEVIGQNPRFLKSGEVNEETYRELWATLTAGKEWKGEFRNKKKNGDLFWESASISPIKNENGVSTHYLAVKEDITERKIAETELISAKENAEESNRLKTHFMNNISHEIRTPLNGIIGFGDYMIDETISREEKLEFYHLLQINSNRLQQTIADIMDISELKAGAVKPKIKEVNLVEILSNLKEKADFLSSKKNILVTIQVSAGCKNLIIRSDEELFTKIMTRLVDNAVKFTTAGRIIIGMDMVEDQLEIYVKDTGKGIAPDKLEIIFEPFMQAETAMSRGYEGSGLGLSIAAGLTDLLGGKIRVNSKKDEGSTFFLTFPLTTCLVETDSGKRVIPREELRSNPVVLIAEDDKSSTQLLQVILQKSGFSTFYAVNGAEAVDFCRQYPEFTLVLMDIKMPIMNGMEAMEKIKAMRPGLPVIALTAHAQTGDRNRMLEAGFDDYLAKPFRKHELLAVIKKFCW